MSLKSEIEKLREGLEGIDKLKPISRRVPRKPKKRDPIVKRDAVRIVSIKAARLEPAIIISDDTATPGCKPYYYVVMGAKNNTPVPPSIRKLSRWRC